MNDTVQAHVEDVSITQNEHSILWQKRKYAALTVLGAQGYDTL